ncbi:hypothetical protein PP747_gp079 [Rhizobium phage RHph_Y38]|uniref:Uncharacterized protein n=2 Tax=Acanvirus TaxID=3044653 RepID=A0A7S5R4I1_9CAUD|nr:hypothetical protein PP747_gp079 [Rhizobium phage RHph_Y38]YP_010658288.1 hypothetical protein PP749_gp077 [Rhizobium phage RHEph22]QIG67780.1 hypothetical protein EVB52_079 [Rhizobium phage RHph_Y38]QXV74750.1 hypothetical protein [Rhizobium phage RHEph22]QXV74844.1 hypothetical protein [Rhizobium phage RHEph24]
MGLFSSSKKTFVDSVVYNMAGDEDERVNYLQATTLNTIMRGDPKTYIGQSINESYLHGPGMNLRSFYRWAQDNYSYIGLPTGSINGTGTINEAVVRANIPGTSGQEIILQTVDIHRADYMDWAIQKMYQSYESLIDTNWTADIVGTTITIHFEDTTTTSFTATGFDASARYLYVLYSTSTPDSTSGTTTGSTTTIDSPDDWPSLSGWRTVSDTETPVTGGYERHAVYEQEVAQPHVFVGSVEMQVIRHNTMYWDQVVTDLGGGIYETTYTWRVDYYDVTSPVNEDFSVYLYKMNTGVKPALDALDDVVSSVDGQFFPIIPMRVNNQWLSDVNGTAYDIAKKAYKKVFNGASYDECIDKLADNEKLSDIDFANVVFGVSLNVKEQKCKKYLYHFFLNLLNNQTYGKATYEAYGPRLDDYRDYVHDLQVWSSFDGMAGPAPDPVPHPIMQLNSVTISNNGSVNTEYSVTILWNYIEELSGVGVYSGLRKGQVTLVNQGTVEYNDPNYSDPSPVTTFDIIWQRTSTSWVGVRVVGALHRNYVYNGKYTETYAGEALDDPDESGFIVPLHYNTFKDMGIVDGTQMSTACSFMVLNCYKIVKIKWYQKGIFRILLVVVFAIAAALFTGGAGFGLLGSNLAIGTSLGFSGLTAGIVGSVVNALAAVALSTVLQPIMQKLGIIGQLLGVLVSFAIGAVASSFSTGASINWLDLFKPGNLLKITNALADGYSTMVQANAQSMYESSQQIQASYEDESAKVDALYDKLVGYANPNINPLNFVDNTRYMYPETRDTFLTRTLLTGSDIAELSQSLLTDFSDLTLKLPGYLG